MLFSIRRGRFFERASTSTPITTPTATPNNHRQINTKSHNDKQQDYHHHRCYKPTTTRFIRGAFNSTTRHTTTTLLYRLTTADTNQRHQISLAGLSITTTTNNPLCAGKEVMLETLSHSPRVFSLYNFMDMEEADNIIEDALGMTVEAYRLKVWCWWC